MTISEEQTRYVYKGPYAIGDTAPIPFTYSEPEHVKALRDKTALELNVEFSVLGQNITMLTPIASAESLVIYRETPMDNDAEFPQEGAFDSEKINNAIDKLTRQNQEQEEAIGRALKLPIDSPVTITDINLPIPEANKGLKWDGEGKSLINTKYDTDEIAEDAKKQAEYAAQQAALAAQKAQEAADSAATAGDKSTEISQVVATAKAEVEKAAEDASAGVTTEITNAKNEAIADVTESGADIISTAQSWAIGDNTARPEGSAKWWAEQAAQSIRGDVYTKNETDALLNTKADKFTVDSTLVMSNERVLGLNPTALEGNYPTKQDMNTAITNAVKDKQDKLTAGTNITIVDNVISATGGGGGGTVTDAYTKAETNNLLAAKQDKLTAGTNISIKGTTISSTVDAYTRSETQGLLSAKQNTLSAGAYITISGNTISATPETMLQTFTESAWNNKSEAEKQAIKFALIYEE